VALAVAEAPAVVSKGRVTVSLYFDPNDSATVERLRALKPQPGYCVFIDIVESTEMKDRGLPEWARAFSNVFENTRAFLAHSAPLKSLGDALMYYTPEGVLSGPVTGPLAVNPAGAEAHRLFQALVSVARDPDPLYERVKVAVAYCSDAYPLTFVKDREDIYGKDIDLTARLLGRANPRDIVMNEPFVQRLRAARDVLGDVECPEVKRIVGPWPERFKGFKIPVPIYKLSAS
jgi:class 3 adenylate cyclase